MQKFKLDVEVRGLISVDGHMLDAGVGPLIWVLVVPEIVLMLGLEP